MERQLTVEFGPSRSKRFGKALAEAENGPGECSELEPGRYRASFVLGNDAAATRPSPVCSSGFATGEHPPLVLEITYGPKLRALLRGDLDSLTQESEQRAKAFSVRVPVQTLDMIS